MSGEMDYKGFLTDRQNMSQDGTLPKYSPMAETLFSALGTRPNSFIENTVMNPTGALLNALGVKGNRMPGPLMANYQPIAAGLLKATGADKNLSDRGWFEFAVNSALGGAIGLGIGKASQMAKVAGRLRLKDIARSNREWKALKAKEVSDYMAARELDNASIYDRMAQSKKMSAEIMSDRMQRLKEIMAEKPKTMFDEIMNSGAK